jgi:hypothetical protein
MTAGDDALPPPKALELPILRQPLTYPSNGSILHLDASHISVLGSLFEVAISWRKKASRLDDVWELGKESATVPLHFELFQVVCLLSCFARGPYLGRLCLHSLGLHQTESRPTFLSFAHSG